MNSNVCLNQKAKELRREGKIDDRFDWEDNKGFHTRLWITLGGEEWIIKMLNGEVCWIRNVGG